MANIGHVPANCKNNLILQTTDTFPVESVLAHTAVIE
jgi:hypothetical protein